MGAGKQFDGPRVRVVSATKQVFQRRSYYLCGKYFADTDGDGERRLHRAVWVAHGGTIPDGFHVHHIDGDRSNNQIENLACLRGSEHSTHHGLEQADRVAAMGRKFQPHTKEWHASVEGREWHRQHYQSTAEKLRARESAVCDCCGKPFAAAVSVKNSAVRYCSKACKAHARRQSGVDDVDRTCGKCGATFRANRYRSRKNCGECFVARRAKRLLPDGS